MSETLRLDYDLDDIVTCARCDCRVHWDASEHVAEELHICYECPEVKER